MRAHQKAFRAWGHLDLASPELDWLIPFSFLEKFIEW